MAVEEHSDEDKAIFAMTTNFKHGPNGSLSVRRPSSPTAFFGPNSVKESNGVEDDELTSLAWLQDTNLLKNFQMGSYGIEGEDLLSDSPSSDYLDETAEHVTVAGDEGEQNVEPLPAHSPYNPTLHANSKPPFSFSCLIFMAIEDSLNKALPVKDIYNWILTHFPYFQNAPTGWKNSVRHNLSLSKCFRKVEKEKGQNVGKGSLWCIDPEFRPNLLQALQKAPSMANLEFSHFSYVSPTYCQNGKTESEVKPCLLVSSQEAIQIPSPELFPFLSRRLASSMKGTSSSLFSY
ncbi:Forkhead box protein N3 [Araneus ventricosus]|uniref:Forkhead box protein N3 n=1 Tax=Araneus ventricosus TaxID=182803 RepID=A0A4Y2I6D8_ARAVE|nr:Forkhead box protein N3 [Araneus ventricosus]